MEETPPCKSLSYEPLAEYSDDHRWSSSMPVLAASRGHEWIQNSPTSCLLCSRTPSNHGRGMLLPTTCFTCYNSGHSIISFPDKIRERLKPRLLCYHIASYNLLIDGKEAWLNKIDKLSLILYGSQSLAMSPALLPHHTDPI